MATITGDSGHTSLPDPRGLPVPQSRVSTLQAIRSKLGHARQPERGRKAIAIRGLLCQSNGPSLGKLPGSSHEPSATAGVTRQTRSSTDGTKVAKVLPANGAMSGSFEARAERFSSRHEREISVPRPPARVCAAYSMRSERSKQPDEQLNAVIDKVHMRCAESPRIHRMIGIS